MRCSRCRVLSIQRIRGGRAAFKCTNAECAIVLDADGHECALDPGPWPSRADLCDLPGLAGSMHVTGGDGRVFASWTYARGSTFRTA